MTTPILDLVYPRRYFDKPLAAGEAAASGFSIVIPVSRPESAAGLAHIAARLGQPDSPARVFGLALRRPSIDETLGTALSPIEPDMSDALRVLMHEGTAKGVPVEPVTMVSRDLASDIARVARATHADLILMGSHKPVLGQTILGGTVHRVLTGSDTDVGIFVDRGVPRQLNILLPYQGTAHDRLALSLVRRMAAAPDVKVTILHVVSGKPAGGGPTGIRKQQFPDSVSIWVVEDAPPVDAVLRHAGEFNLVVLGLSEEWGLESQLFGLRAERIASEWPDSLLLVRKHAPPEALRDNSEIRSAAPQPVPPTPSSGE